MAVKECWSDARGWRLRWTVLKLGPGTRHPDSAEVRDRPAPRSHGLDGIWSRIALFQSTLSLRISFGRRPCNDDGTGRPLWPQFGGHSNPSPLL